MTDQEVIEAVFIIIGFFAALAGFIVAANLVAIDVKHRLRQRRRGDAR